MPKVICQKWLESERGWGTRPDGYTLHLTEAHRKRFVEAFWKRQKELLGNSTPDEYSREDGESYECPVTDTIYQKVKASGDGVWCWTLEHAELVRSGRAAPWPGGPDGWKSEHPPRLDVEVD